jgi:hypothetical protein
LITFLKETYDNNIWGLENSITADAVSLSLLREIASK